MTPLPRSYELLADLLDLVGVDQMPGPRAGMVRARFQELTIELWKAGQVEHRAIDGFEYDQPLWCKGASIEEVTKRVGVPWGASDPAKDLGRGRSYR